MLCIRSLRKVLDSQLLFVVVVVVHLNHFHTQSIPLSLSNKHTQHILLILHPHTPVPSPLNPPSPSSSHTTTCRECSVPTDSTSSSSSPPAPGPASTLTSHPQPHSRLQPREHHLLLQRVDQTLKQPQPRAMNQKRLDLHRIIPIACSPRPLRPRGTPPESHRIAARDRRSAARTRPPTPPKAPLSRPRRSVSP